MKKLVQSIRPKKYGVIVRTAAQGKKVADLNQELQSLVDKWETSFQKLKRAQAPSLVIGEIDRATAMLRDIYNPNFNSIIVNDQSVCNEITGYITSIQPDKRRL